MCVRSIDLDRDTEGFSEETHDLQTFLIVGPSMTDENADVVGDEESLVLLESMDDILEGGGGIGEVSNN